MNFNAYNNKDLQHCVQLLTQCEANGITDVRFIREKLHRHIYKIQSDKPIRGKRRIAKKVICPECGGSMRPIANGDGLNILGCGKCRYSEVVK